MRAAVLLLVALSLGSLVACPEDLDPPTDVKVVNDSSQGVQLKFVEPGSAWHGDADEVLDSGEAVNLRFIVGRVEQLERCTDLDLIAATLSHRPRVIARLPAPICSGKEWKIGG
jgi:hypothetical protein